MDNQKKEDYKSASEKLLNTLGRNMAIKYYGYDGYYSVDDLTEYEDDVIDLFITTDKDIPEILDVKIEPNFIYGKYADASDLIGNLQSFLKYLGRDNVFINITDKEPRRDKLPYQNDFKEKPNEFIHLCNGDIIQKSTGNIFPLLFNGLIDERGYINNIARIDDEDWWESLCDDDKIELNKTYS